MEFKTRVACLTLGGMKCLEWTVLTGIFLRPFQVEGEVYKKTYAVVYVAEIAPPHY
ncbi:hypothetical protein ACOJR9_05360 [Alteromonas sp. A081]|uniref:hypothetical protein n=1 Tax=Alteromonas sp. A081 TaxID=3410269 RepID=UPI003B980C52